MALSPVFCTGFETGLVPSTNILLGWDTTTGSTISVGNSGTRNIRSGTYALRINRAANAAASLRRTTGLSGTYSRASVRFGFCVVTLPSSGKATIAFVPSGLNMSWSITVSSAGDVRLEDAGQTTSVSLGTVSAGTTYHYIDWQYSVQTSTWDSHASLDGGTVQALTQAGGAGGTVGGFAIGTKNTNEAATVIDYDDILVGGTFATSYSSADLWGDGSVEWYGPSTDGTHSGSNNFSPGDAGTAYSSSGVTLAHNQIVVLPWASTRSTTTNIAQRTASATAYMEFKPTQKSTHTGLVANCVGSHMLYSSSGTQANNAGMIIKGGGNTGIMWGDLPSAQGGFGGALADYSENPANFGKSFFPFTVASGQWDDTTVNGIVWRFGGSTDISPIPTLQSVGLEVDWPAVSGSALTANVNDTATMSDSITGTEVGRTATPADTATMSDAQAFDFGEGVADTASAGDSASPAAGFNTAPADTATTSDAQTPARGFNTFPADTATAGDSATPQSGKEALVNDTATTGDAQTPAAGFNAAPADTATAADAQTPAAGFNTAPSDTATMSDAQAFGFGEAVADTATTGDSATAQTGKAVAPADSLAILDGADYNAEVLADAPDLFWDLDETSGTSVADSSGNNRGGTYTSGITLGDPGLVASDTDNRSVRLSNVTGSGMIATSYQPHPAGGETRTYEVIANRASRSNNHYFFGGSSNAMVGMMCPSGTDDIQFVSNTGATGTWTGAMGGIGVTKHVAVVYIASTGVAELFVNKVSQGTRSGLGATGTNTICFGNNQGHASGAYAWDGWLDKAAVYPSALSPTRIAAHFDAAVAAAGLTTSVAGNRTVPDTATVADARAFGYGETIADTATAGDAQTPAAGFNTAPADTVTMADAQTPSKGFNPSVSDSATPTDAQAFGYGEAVADTATAGDSQTTLVGRTAAPADTATVTDAQTFGYGEGVNDTATTSDATTTASDYNTFPADTATVGDTATPQSSGGVTIPDTATATDAQSVSGDFNRFPADTATAADAQTVSGDFNRAASDTATATDAQTPSQGYGRTVPDTATVTDATSFGVATTITDAVSALDAASTSVGFAISTTDTATLADALRFDYGKGVADSVTPGDSQTTAAGWATQVSDTLVIADAASTASGIQAALADSVSVADATAIARAIQQTLADSANVTDAQTFERAIQAALADSVTASDATSTASGVALTIPDILVISDARSLGIGKAVDDALTVTDFINIVGAGVSAAYIHHVPPLRGDITPNNAQGIVAAVATNQLVAVYSASGLVVAINAAGEVVATGADGLVIEDEFAGEVVSPHDDGGNV